MKHLLIVFALLAALLPQTSLVAPARAATTTQKLCLPSNTTVGYSIACPAGTTSTKKICPDGTIVGYTSSCLVPAPAPSPTPTPVAGATYKLCLPGGMLIAYTASCPSGTTQTMKVCPYGQQVAYSSACPKTPAVLTYGGKATPQLACQSQWYSPDATLVIGKVYTVVGFAALVPLGEVDINSTARDVVILNDETHRGDGAFAIWVPINCVAAQ